MISYSFYKVQVWGCSICFFYNSYILFYNFYKTGLCLQRQADRRLAGKNACDIDKINRMGIIL